MAKKHLMLDDIIKPKGLGSAVPIKAIVDNLRERYYKSINKTIKLLAIKKGDNIIIKASVPSEGNGDYLTKIFYDVILEFYPIDKDFKDAKTIGGYGVNAFSNCPSFTFAFTYVFNKNDALPSFIPKKFYDAKALKMKAKERNPMELTAIDKSIWFLVEHMRENDLFKKNRLNIIHQKDRDIKYILGTIKSQEDKLDEVEYAVKEYRIKKQMEKIKTNLKKSGSTSKSKPTPKVKVEKKPTPFLSQLKSKTKAVTTKSKTTSTSLKSKFESKLSKKRK